MKRKKRAKRKKIKNIRTRPEKKGKKNKGKIKLEESKSCHLKYVNKDNLGQKEEKGRSETRGGAKVITILSWEKEVERQDQRSMVT